MHECLFISYLDRIRIYFTFINEVNAMISKGHTSNDIDSYKKLSVAERIQLVEDIWDSIGAETQDSFSLSKEQKEELYRRIEAHHSNPSSCIPWEKVRKKMFQQEK